MILNAVDISNISNYEAVVCKLSTSEIGLFHFIKLLNVAN